MSGCLCSEDGPCEAHADFLVIREGASLHTGDELTLLLVTDLVDCGVILSEADADELKRLEAALEADWNPESGTSWFSDRDNAEAAEDLASRVESEGGDLWVMHNDGYVIARPHDDCPLTDGGST